MSHVRVCGQKCHEAKGPKCRCWCGGVFHGAKGKSNRENWSRVMYEMVLTDRANKKYKSTMQQQEIFETQPA